LNDRGVGRISESVKLRTLAVVIPRPRVAKPYRRQQVKLRRFGASIGRAYANEYVFGSRLRVFDDDIEIAIIVEYACVHQLEFRLLTAATPIFFGEPRVRELGLRVFVEKLHVAVRRCRIEIEVILFDILAVIALGAAESKQALFQYGIAPVPQRKRKADILMAVRDPGYAVFAPAVSFRLSMCVRQVVPRGPVRAVVFANGSPRAFAQVWAPPLPP